MYEATIMGAPGAAMTRDGLLRSDPTVNDEGRDQLIHVTADQMQARIKPFVDKCRAIRGDGPTGSRKLTAKGVAARTLDEYKALDADMDQFAAVELVANQAKRADFIANQTGNLFARFRGGEVPGSQETRALMRDMKARNGGQVEVDILFRTAAHDGDTVSLSAVVDSPPGFPLCSDKLIAEMQEVYRGVVFPDDVAEEREIRAMLKTIDFNAATARSAATKLAGLGDLAIQK